MTTPRQESEDQSQTQNEVETEMASRYPKKYLRATRGGRWMSMCWRLILNGPTEVLFAGPSIGQQKGIGGDDYPT